MATPELRQRPAAKDVPAPNLAAGLTEQKDTKYAKDQQHPAGKVKHGPVVATLRALTFAVYFATSCTV